MGERLGAVDRLRQQGVVAIRPEEGAAAMLAVLADETAPVTVMVSSRVPDTQTLNVRASSERRLRFTEEELIHTAEVETVLRAGLSLGTDPYLDDHRVDGIPMLPAVIGLEGMAQAAASLTGPREEWSFTDVVLSAPITVAEHGSRVVQIAALAGERGDQVDVALRDDADGFGTVRFSGTVRTAPPLPSHIDLPTAPPAPVESHPLYGPLFFHSGQFRRLVRFDHLSAFEVRAWINADDHARWFSDFHSRRLLLGDPGAHDAAVHILLACLPHRRALPVGIDRVTMWRRPHGLLRVHATERWHSGDEYCFDVDVHSADGVAVSRWEGLRLHAIGPRPWRDPLPLTLVGPLLSRRLIELGVGDRTELTLSTAGQVRGHWANLLVTTDPAVALVSELASGIHPSRQSAKLTMDIVGASGEDPLVAASRVRCATRALDVLGGVENDRLVLDRAFDDGVVLLRSGRTRIVTAGFTTELPRPLLAAIARADGG